MHAYVYWVQFRLVDLVNKILTLKDNRPLDLQAG